MKTVLSILSGDLSTSAYIWANNSLIDLNQCREINLEDNGKEFILYLKSNIFQDIELDRFKDKYQLAKKLSEITIALNYSRINYSYTKEFEEWMRTTKSY